MESIVKICLISLLAALAALLIKGKNQPAAFLLSATVCAYIVFQVVPWLRQIYDFCKRLTDYTGVDISVMLPLIKVTVLAVCVRITAELCRDAGERAVAAKVEVAGAAAGILFTLPLISQALKIIGAL